MAAGGCVVHFSTNTIETVVLLGQIKKDNILSYAAEWVKYSKEPEKTVAAQVIASQNSISVDSVCHPLCYSRFTNSSRGQRSKVAFDKVSTGLIVRD